MKALIFLKYCLYFLFTLEARNRYMQGKSKGYHCYKSVNGLSYTDYYYDRNKKPEREYVTWKEFKENHKV